jgi:hypothetical protein
VWGRQSKKRKSIAVLKMTLLHQAEEGYCKYIVILAIRYFIAVSKMPLSHRAEDGYYKEQIFSNICHFHASACNTIFYSLQKEQIV